MIDHDPPTAAPSADHPSDATGWRVPPRLRVASEIVLRVAVLAVAALVSGWVLLELWVLTVPLLVALLITSVLQPLSNRLVAHRWPPLLATWTVLAGGVALFAALGTLIVPYVTDELGEVGANVEEGLADIESWMEDGPLGIADADLVGTFSDVGQQVASAGGTDQAIAAATFTTEVVAAVVLIPVITFFLMKDGPRITAGALAATPRRHRQRLRAVAAASWSTLSSYVRGTAIIGVVNGTVIGIGLVVIGVPLAAPLAALTAVSAFFPLVGAVVAGAVAALVALVAVGVPAAIAVLVLVVVVQQLEGDLLSPLVMGRVLALHPLVVLVALTLGAVLAGVLGAFVAVPLTATVIAGYKAGKGASRSVIDEADDAEDPDDEGPDDEGPRTERSGGS